MVKKSISFVLSFVLLLGFGVLLLYYPQESAMAARDGLTLCTELIIPSLFPFFVLSSLLVSMGFAELLGRLLGGLMWPLFRLNPGAATAWVLGAVGGYPVGARMSAQLYEHQQINQVDALRLSAFCNNCGPAFLFSVAGWGIFASKSAGFLLLLTHLGASLLVGLLFRYYPMSKEILPLPLRAVERRGFSVIFPDCVKDSFASTLNVCAFVILFSVILRLSDCAGVLTRGGTFLSFLLGNSLSPELCKALLQGILELSCGISALAPFSHHPAALPLAAFILAWGGLSVHCQTLPFLRKTVLTLKPYFGGKLIQSLLAALLTAILAPLLLTTTTTVMLPSPEILSIDSTLRLLRNECFALWVLSGIFWLFSHKKALVKCTRVHYNRYDS